MTVSDAPDSTDRSPRPRSARARAVLRRGLHVAGILLVVALVVPFVIYAVPGVVGADASYVVLSDSMQPTIGVNDVVIVAAVDPATIQPGDVVTYERDPRNPPITHRVVERFASDGGTAFITKGDANEEADPSPVPADALVGTVLFTIPAIGLVIRYVGTDAGFAVLVLVPIALLALSEIAAFLRPARTPAATGEHVAENDGGRDGGNDPGDGSGDADSMGPVATDAGAAPVVTAVPAVRIEDDDALVETTAAAPVGDGTDRTNHDGRAAGSDATAGESDSAPAGIQLSKRDVAGTSVALFLLAVYAGYVGYRLQDATSVMVAAGAGMLALLGLGARLTWPTPPAGAASRPGRVALVVASLPASAETAQRVVVDSLGSLYALAESTRHPVIHDEAAECYALLDGDVVYWLDATAATTDSAGSTGASAPRSDTASKQHRPGDGGDAYATDGSGDVSPEVDDAS